MNIFQRILKAALLSAFLLSITLSVFAVSTTYTFCSNKWESKIGIVNMDGKTDGWISNKDATDYNSGYTDINGRLYSAGVGVKTSTSGAGASSCMVFENVKSITVNYCQNSSKGRGCINMKVGEGDAQSFSIEKPKQSGTGVYNRDTTFCFSEETGNVTFWIDCTENGIYINTITIEAENGSPDNPDVSDNIFWIVTDPAELQDGDLVMFGVSDCSVDEVMGLFDEANSQNNIYSIKAKYDKSHVYVSVKEEAVYSVERYDSLIAFTDIYGYYLVASGGNPNKGNNNYLTIWDKCTSSAYGDYGLWNVTVDVNHDATIKNCGVSRSNIIQYNPNKQNSHAIFACYPDRNYVMPRIYKWHGKNSTGISHTETGDNDVARHYPKGTFTLSGQRIQSVDEVGHGVIIIKDGKLILHR